MLLIVKFNEDVTSFVVPRYNSTSFNCKCSTPVVVLLEITTQLFPTGHKELHTKLPPEPVELYPGKQTHVPPEDDEPNGHCEETKVIDNPKIYINLKKYRLFIYYYLFQFPRLKNK
jgi:hypothetical protein